MSGRNRVLMLMQMTPNTSENLTHDKHVVAPGSRNALIHNDFQALKDHGANRAYLRGTTARSVRNGAVTSLCSRRGGVESRAL